MKRIIITLCICTAWVASTYAQYPYTLKKCLEEGLANNYSICITRNEEQISHNNATLANAGYLPTVDLSAGYTGTLDNTDTKSRSTGTTASERNIYDQTLKAGLDVNWTLFDGFNISTTYKKLKELERQGETNTRITLEDFIAGLTAEYYNYVQQESLFPDTVPQPFCVPLPPRHTTPWLCCTHPLRHHISHPQGHSLSGCR